MHFFLNGETTWRGPFKAICDWKVMDVTDDVHKMGRDAVDVKFKRDNFHIT